MIRLVRAVYSQLSVNVRPGERVAPEMGSKIRQRANLPFRHLILPPSQLELSSASGRDCRPGDSPEQAAVFRLRRGKSIFHEQASLFEVYSLSGLELPPVLETGMAELSRAFQGLAFFSKLHFLSNVLDDQSRLAFVGFVKDKDKALYERLILPYYIGAEPMEDLRATMVKTQLKERGIKDKRVLKVMGELPREAFLPEGSRDQAYEDNAVAITGESSISQPYLVALMTQALRLRGGEKVLEIGTGSGYQAAILGRLARTVYTIERIPELAARARAVLSQLGIKNVEVVDGPGELGFVEKAPFDRIIVTAGCENDVPPALFDQLANGGKMVAPIGRLDNGGIVGPLFLLTKNGGGRGIKREILRECVGFVPLVTGQ